MDNIIAESGARGSSVLEMLRLSWPACLTMLSTTLIKFVDGWMVSHVSHRAMGAQYVSGMMSFAPEALAMGALLVINTFVSQNIGAGRHRSAGRYALTGLLMALCFAACLLPLIAMAGPLFSRVMGHSKELAALETMYFRYLIVGALLTLPSRSIEQFCYGMGRMKVILGVSIITNAFNIAANYCLIFGHLGFPAMGLQGAAIGSMSAWILQLTILLTFFLSPQIRKRYGTHHFGAVRWRYCKDLLRIGWPTGMQFFNNILGWSLFNAVLITRLFGEVHMAAATVANRYLGLAFMPAVGIGIAATAIVGRHIGEGRSDLARKSSHAAVLLAVCHMLICGLAFCLFRYPMARFMLENVPGAASEHVRAALTTQPSTVVDIAATILLCAAVFEFFDAVSIVYIGALRGAGDTYWPMVMTMSLSWTVILGGGYAMARSFPQLGSLGPWLAAAAYVVALALCMAWRFESGAWRKINLLGGARPMKATKLS